MHEKSILRKQAYLIIAHKNDLGFKTLLKMLDDPRNDLFIHMDKKNKYYDIDETKQILKKSSVYHTERTNVTWGGYSQINAELLLLKKATTVGKYQHYHLLSGACLPIKTQTQIISFFEKNEDKEFIRFEKSVFSYQERTKYYHFLQDKVGRSHNLILRGLELLLVKMQKIFKIKRNENVKFQKGTNWFSITDGFARYVIDKETWIKKTFKYTYCCDEVFLQTLLISSPYVENLYHKNFDNDLTAIMRLIDWSRGKPYTFRMSDYDDLCESNMLFARKFDSNVDSEIIEAIENKFSICKRNYTEKEIRNNELKY